MVDPTPSPHPAFYAKSSDFGERERPAFRPYLSADRLIDFLDDVANRYSSVIAAVFAVHLVFFFALSQKLDPLERVIEPETLSVEIIALEAQPEPVAADDIVIPVAPPPPPPVTPRPQPRPRPTPPPPPPVVSEPEPEIVDAPPPPPPPEILVNETPTDELVPEPLPEPVVKPVIVPRPEPEPEPLPEPVVEIFEPIPEPFPEPLLEPEPEPVIEIFEPDPLPEMIPEPVVPDPLPKPVLPEPILPEPVEIEPLPVIETPLEPAPVPAPVFTPDPVPVPVEPLELPPAPVIVETPEPLQPEPPVDIFTPAPTILASPEAPETQIETDRAVPVEQAAPLSDLITGGNRLNQGNLPPVGLPGRNPNIAGPSAGGGNPQGGTRLASPGAGGWTLAPGPSSPGGGFDTLLDDVRCREDARSHADCPEYLRRNRGRDAAGVEAFTQGRHGGRGSRAGITGTVAATSKTASGDIGSGAENFWDEGIGSTMSSTGPSSTVLDDTDFGKLFRGQPVIGAPTGGRIRDMFAEPEAEEDEWALELITEDGEE